MKAADHLQRHIENHEFQLPNTYWERLKALKVRMSAGSATEVFKAALNALEEKLDDGDKRKKRKAKLSAHPNPSEHQPNLETLIVPYKVEQ